MYLTGYHGTTHDKAERILNEKKFNISKGEKEWLGKGIYFYFHFSDALDWRMVDSIIHSLIVVEDDEYLDLTTVKGQKLHSEVINYLCSQGFIPPESTQESQCAVMNQLWEYCPRIKVIAAEFAKEKTKIKTMVDSREKRKEFCVRDNNSIIITHIINREDLK